MTKSLVWIISGNPEKLLKNRGVSAAYIIPAGAMNGLENSLCESSIWILTKSKGLYLQASIKPNKVERFTDGLNRGDFLLTVSLVSSFRFAISNSIDNELIFKELASIPIGISLISKALDDLFLDFVNTKIRIRLTSPNPSIFSPLRFDNHFKTRSSIAEFALSFVVQNFNLTEMWASGIGKKLGPFVNFTYAFIKSKIGSGIAEECLNDLIGSDPLTSRNYYSEIQIHKFEKSKYFPKVDIILSEIDPETIYAREFIATENFSFDLESALDKTQASEKAHQDMLRDISKYLISKNITPFQTNSIDLVIENNNQTIFYEIKSANDTNFYAQVAKGAFQISYYAEALKNEYEQLKYSIIVNKINSEQVQLSCINTLKRMGITCLIYDESLKWPDRVKNLTLV